MAFPGEGKRGAPLRSPLLCPWDQGTGGAWSGSPTCTCPHKEWKLLEVLHVVLEKGNYPHFAFPPLL